MLEPDAQGAEATLGALSSVLETLYREIESAVHESRKFFEPDKDTDTNRNADTDVQADTGTPIDRALFPNLVRYYVKCALGKRGIHAVEEDVPVLEHTILANNGLLVEYGDRRIRIRKADHGGLPAASSGALESFYEQRSLLEAPVEYQNLMLLWDDAAGGVYLQLVCPKQRDGEPHWSTSVPHPAELHRSSDDTRASATEAFEFDLPIRLPKASSDDEQ